MWGTSVRVDLYRAELAQTLQTSMMPRPLGVSFHER